VVLDVVGGDWAQKNIACLKPQGRLVQIGFGKSPSVEIDLRLVMAKQAIITGSLMRPRSADEKARLTRKVLDVVWPLMESRKIKTVIDAVFDLKDASLAHARLEASEQCGKVVLRV
jgi:NADPH:quinone reductase